MHDVAGPSENTLYAAELSNWCVQKLTPEKGGAPASAAGRRE
jgi:hypothetical protein